MQNVATQTSDCEASPSRPVPAPTLSSSEGEDEPLKPAFFEPKPVSRQRSVYILCKECIEAILAFCVFCIILWHFFRSRYIF